MSNTDNADMTNRWREVPPAPRARCCCGDPVAYRAKVGDHYVYADSFRSTDAEPLYLAPPDLAAENARLNGRLAELEDLARLHASLHVEHGKAKVRVAEQDTIIDELRTRLSQKMDDCTKAQQRIAELEAEAKFNFEQYQDLGQVSCERESALTAALEKAREKVELIVEEGIGQARDDAREAIAIIDEALK